MSNRLSEIRQQNAKLEKKAPYNFCDRWCERCVTKKQIRCTLYLNEVEQQMTCIAHGREPDDLEITSKVIEKQYEGLDKFLESYQEEVDEYMNSVDNLAIDEIIRSVENDPLYRSAENYYRKAHDFLKKVFAQNSFEPDISYNLETVNWYHALLPSKINRALSGFYAPDGDDFSICDAVAQLQICKKAITQSIDALRKIDKNLGSYHDQILDLLALLQNISSRMENLQKSI